MADWTTTTSGTGDITWVSWVDGISASSSTVSYDRTWSAWTSDGASSGGSVAYRSAPDYVPPPETEEQRQAKIEKQEVERQRLELARLAREEAQRKAEELLRESLDEEQREQFDKTTWFFVISQSGKRYRIRHGWVGNIDELNEEGLVVADYCIHPAMRVPTEDSMLVQKLMLEGDEQRFLQIANRTARSTPRPLAV